MKSNTTTKGWCVLDGHVRFQSKYYSVAEQYIRQLVTVIGTPQISIYYQGKLIEVHQPPDLTYTVQVHQVRHHMKPWEQACDNDEALLAQAAKIGPHAQGFVYRVLQDGDGFIDFRRIWVVLSLDKKYRREEIEVACAEALDCGDLTYRAVVRFIVAAQEANTPCAAPSSPRPPRSFHATWRNTPRCF